MSLPIDVSLQHKPFHHRIPIVTSRLRDRYKVFINEDAASKYQAFENYETKMVMDLQGQGMNLPILGFQWHSVSKIASIHKSFVPNGEIFDENKHSKTVCKVAKYSHKQYWTYQLTFIDQTIDTFVHRSHPIADFRWNGKRYRWVYYGNYRWYSSEEEFSYSLFELDPSQPSLVDGAKPAVVDQNNELLGGTLTSLLFGSSKKRRNKDARKFNSETKVGQLTFNQWKLAVSQVMSSVFSIGSDSSLDSITDVSFDLQIFLIMCLMFQFEEQEEQDKRRKGSGKPNPYNTKIR